MMKKWKFFFFNLSGGFFYHQKALFYRPYLWTFFRKTLHQLLINWNPNKTHLVLIGPSAGYCLSETFLNSFQKITILEPDPFASWLFQRRFQKLKGKTEYSNWNLFPKENPFHIKHLIALQKKFPQSAFLFCNLLGQLPLLFPDQCQEEAFLKWKSRFLEVMESPFASFHDLYSGSFCVKNKIISSNNPLPVKKLMEIFFKKRSFFSAPFSSSNTPLKLFSHQTEDLFAHKHHIYLPWKITPFYTHLIVFYSKPFSKISVS